jgi:hypothetical protein
MRFTPYRSSMDQAIIGFHLDSNNHWVADLACGHSQHVRHHPPWVERPWVLTPKGRASCLGQSVDCVRCDESGRAVAEKVRAYLQQVISRAYDEAGVTGLSAQERWEFALDRLAETELYPAVCDALRIAGHRIEL